MVIGLLAWSALAAPGGRLRAAWSLCGRCARGRPETCRWFGSRSCPAGRERRRALRAVVGADGGADQDAGARRDDVGAGGLGVDRRSAESSSTRRPTRRGPARGRSISRGAPTRSSSSIRASAVASSTSGSPSPTSSPPHNFEFAPSSRQRRLLHHDRGGVARARVARGGSRRSRRGRGDAVGSGSPRVARLRRAASPSPARRPSSGSPSAGVAVVRSPGTTSRSPRSSSPSPSSSPRARHRRRRTTPGTSSPCRYSGALAPQPRAPTTSTRSAWRFSLTHPPNKEMGPRARRRARRARRGADRLGDRRARSPSAPSSRSGASQPRARGRGGGRRARRVFYPCARRARRRIAGARVEPASVVDGVDGSRSRAGSRSLDEGGRGAVRRDEMGRAEETPIERWRPPRGLRVRLRGNDLHFGREGERALALPAPRRRASRSRARPALARGLLPLPLAAVAGGIAATALTFARRGCISGDAPVRPGHAARAILIGPGKPTGDIEVYLGRL